MKSGWLVGTLLLVMVMSMGLLLVDAQEDVEPTVAALMDSIVQTATADADLGLVATAQARLTSTPAAPAALAPQIIRVSPFSTVLEGMESVSDVAFSPDGSLLVTVGRAEEPIVVWDVETGSQVEAFSGQDFNIDDFFEVIKVAFSSDGRFLAVAADANDGGYANNIYIWDTSLESVHATLRGHGQPIVSMAMSNDGTLLASGSRDNTVKIWSLEVGRELATFSGHEHWVNGVSFRSDGLILATSGYQDETIRLWDMQTGFESEIMEIGHITDGVLFHPTMPILAYVIYGSAQKTVYIWDMDSGRDPRILTEYIGVDDVDLAFNRDGSLLAVGIENNIYIYDMKTGEELTLVQQGSNVHGLAFSPTGTQLAAGSQDGTARIWSLLFE